MQAKLLSNGFKLSSANSINWGRLAPQIAYYVSGYCDLISSGKIKYPTANILLSFSSSCLLTLYLPTFLRDSIRSAISLSSREQNSKRSLISSGKINFGDKVNFCVPSGNFGNILAGYYASLTLYCAYKHVVAKLSRHLQLLHIRYSVGGIEYYYIRAVHISKAFQSGFARVARRSYQYQCLGCPIKVSAAEAIVNGISKDGGLFVPEEFPKLTKEDFDKLIEMSPLESYGWRHTRFRLLCCNNRKVSI